MKKILVMFSLTMIAALPLNCSCRQIVKVKVNDIVLSSVVKPSSVDYLVFNFAEEAIIKGLIVYEYVDGKWNNDDPTWKIITKDFVYENVKSIVYGEPPVGFEEVTVPEKLVTGRVYSASTIGLTSSEITFVISDEGKVETVKIRRRKCE